ncbi:hypothetical protein AU381_25930 [Sinorhizobium glycinis]|uniref:Periplasmic heavy metal sensor n=1 Tax=Sinorhizobium glycinis TaxID=1472378 RepID=A0A178XIW6_9HYPH|nr:hypothetical protein [Sinorhizobium glycinis]OAP35189.1 hypothetical protein AU381_25930 [Sinorhizobium glycinis]
MKSLIPAILVFLLSLPAAANEEHVHSSHYAGQQMREIKSLSPDDVSELQNGRGWGLAKAAELNGMPGPSHVLKMKRELGLTADQEAVTRNIFEKMRHEAIAEGKRLIAEEALLEVGFRERSLDRDSLRDRLRGIELSRSSLRYIHLAAHLEMFRVLDEHQNKRYNELRGYGR